MAKSVPLILFGVGCLAAAAGGGYLAARYNALPGTPASATTPADPATGDRAIVTPAPVPPAPDVQAASTQPVSPSQEGPADRTRRPVQAAPLAARPAETRQPATASPALAAERAPEPAPAPVRSQSAAPSGASPVAVAEPVVPAAPVEPPVPEPVFEELVVPADSVLGLQLENTVTSARARVEDPVEARVTRDVTVNERVAIPAGSRVLGSVTLVESGGKVRERARLAIRFHTLLLPDGVRTSLNTDSLYRESESPAGKSAAKIGGAAAGGALLGAILGGRKGAAIGSAVGAAGGTAAVMAGNEQVVALTAGTTVTVRLLSPVTVTVER